MEELLRQHVVRYPLMEPVDLIKLLYQREMAGGHMIEDPQASLRFLREECANLSSREIPLFEGIGGGLCRLNLAALPVDGPSLETVNALFVDTANRHRGSLERLRADLELLPAMAAAGVLPFPLEIMENAVAAHIAAGLPSVHHSQRYRDAYQPAYRVVDAACSVFFPLYGRIDRLLAQKGRVVLAIDGRSGSGKSTLADHLARIYGASLIHMDDFFLRPCQRTPERLAEPGGNLDYERFSRQVISHLGEEGGLAYPIYDCQKGELSGEQRVAPSRLLVVEGSYCLHPQWQDVFDCQVFLTIPPEVQEARIARRNGPFMLTRFLEEWIPLEERYFSAFKIPERCDLVLDTSTLSQ